MPTWLRSLGHSLTGVFGLLRTLWAKVLDVKNNTINLFSNINTLVSDIITVIHDFQTFTINPKWNTRVISAPRVLVNVQELMAIPERVANDVRDLVQQLKTKIEPMEVNLSDLDGLDGIPTKLLSAGEKIIGWLSLVVDSLTTIEAAIADLQDIASALRTVLEDFQGLDGLFLPQGSTKTVVDISYRKRNVGNAKVKNRAVNVARSTGKGDASRQSTAKKARG